MHSILSASEEIRDKLCDMNKLIIDIDIVRIQDMGLTLNHVVMM